MKFECMLMWNLEHCIYRFEKSISMC